MWLLKTAADDIVSHAVGRRTAYAMVFSSSSATPRNRRASLGGREAQIRRKPHSRVVLSGASRVFFIDRSQSLIADCRASAVGMLSGLHDQCRYRARKAKGAISMSNCLPPGPTI